MATFLEIVQDVMDVTGRSDLEVYIRRKVAANIRHLSSLGRFPQDHVEWVFEAADGIDGTAYTQTIILPGDVRRINYLKYPSSISSKEFKGISTDALAKYNLNNVVDAYYQSGNLLHVRNSVLTNSLLMGYYAYPAALADNESNWLTDSAPDIIMELTNLQVLAFVGEKAASNAVANLTSQFLQLFKQDRISGFIPGR